MAGKFAAQFRQALVRQLKRECTHTHSIDLAVLSRLEAGARAGAKRKHTPMTLLYAPPLLEGTLYKVHNSAHGLHRGGSRFLVVDDFHSTLTYYQGTKAYDAERPSRSLGLSTITAVESLDDDCSFRIIAAARTLTLRAHTSAERDEWVEGLRHRIGGPTIGGPRIGGAGRRASLPVRPLSLLRTALPEASGSEEVVDAEEMEERVDAFFSRRRGEVPEQHIEPKSPVPSGADAATAVHVTGDISPRTSPPASARRFSFGGTLMWKPSVRG